MNGIAYTQTVKYKVSFYSDLSLNEINDKFKEIFKPNKKNDWVSVSYDISVKRDNDQPYFDVDFTFIFDCEYVFYPGKYCGPPEDCYEDDYDDTGLDGIDGAFDFFYDEIEPMITKDIEDADICSMDVIEMNPHGGYEVEINEPDIEL